MVHSKGCWVKHDGVHWCEVVGGMEGMGLKVVVAGRSKREEEDLEITFFFFLFCF